MTDVCAEQPTGLLKLPEALAKIYTAIKPIRETEVVSLKLALGRILATPLYSAIDIPAFSNASMDGYALTLSNKPIDKPFSLSVVGTSWAGKPYIQPCLENQCVRIFTGAVVPQNADCVVMQELVQRSVQLAEFTPPLIVNDNIRHPGDDVCVGDLLIQKQQKLSPIDLGLIASAGIYKLSVTRKLRIAFFSTGNELTRLGSRLQPGQIYDSNRYTLTGLLQNPNHEVSDLGVLADDRTLIKTALLDAADNHDLILTTGGASVGDADYIQEILQKSGQVDFWKIAMKPGKPLAFGRLKDSYFFGLPGNPVSVIATFQQVVLPAIQQLSGLAVETPLAVPAICRSPLKKVPGRLEFQRGIYHQLEDGSIEVESAGKQGSHILSSASMANCYIVLDADCTDIAAGDKVTIQPFINFR